MQTVKECQKNLDEAMKNWPNFQNIESILEWCNIIVENYIVGTKINQKKIMEEFKAQSLVPGMNINPVYYGENKENSGRYLVGQFLDNINRGNGAIPKIFHRFYEEWKKKHLL